MHGRIAWLNLQPESERAEPQRWMHLAELLKDTGLRFAKRVTCDLRKHRSRADRKNQKIKRLGQSWGLAAPEVKADSEGVAETELQQLSSVEIGSAVETEGSYHLGVWPNIDAIRAYDSPIRPVISPIDIVVFWEAGGFEGIGAMIKGLNKGPYWRLGKGKNWEKGARVIRLSIGHGEGHPHIDFYRIETLRPPFYQFLQDPFVIDQRTEDPNHHFQLDPIINR
jgi:hypothetical protein